MEIKQLFDPSRDIYRSIEKVIAYGVSHEDRLRKEIAEYVVTDAIDEQFNQLLTKMQAAMEAGGENEVGVWVSGFYGSGKSSFTKYLGLAFDDSVTIDGAPFRQHLQDRLKNTTTRQLLSTVSKRFPAAVLMLDLATEQVSGATMEEVSSVLYYKVLQWAGYSRNLKVAALERRLKHEGRYEEFLRHFEEKTGGEAWSDYRNDELVVDSLIPEIAHDLYPTLFTSPGSFNTATSEVIRFENDRVQEMLDIVREHSGKEYVIFIVDEVGQYVGARQSLILNLDGLAKNIKALGNGKVWLIGTAQQTLTEDDPRASLNAPELFRLKDRFPIGIDLEADDIKEICYTRLLGKSPEGAQRLGELFDQHGQALRHNTKLEDARAYGADFDRQTFIDLYPFLPAHFDILLHLLGALARSTGGIGLRSAIKVIQDILIEGEGKRVPVAQQPVGWLANTVTLYDALEKDIERGFSNWQKAVNTVTKIRYKDEEIQQRVAKTVAVLQILGNLPITRRNVASLIHSDVASGNQVEEINAAIEALITDPIVPFGEQDGFLCFFSEKLNDIEQERSQIPLRGNELKRILNRALEEVFSPVPSVQLHGSLSVQSGLKTQGPEGLPISLAGDRHPIQTVVELVEPTDYEAARSRLQDESRVKTNENVIYLVGRKSPELDDLIADIYRCQEVDLKFRHDPDQEVRDYCRAQVDRARRLGADLQRLLKRSLQGGSFIFRGQANAVDSLAAELGEAARKQLAAVAGQVFSRYGEAPERVQSDLAERFLKVGNLSGITSKLDPLGLVVQQGGQTSINVDHRALVSIRDHIDRVGMVEGKSLANRFSDAPYGWSQDTLRYLVAAMLLGGVIKLKVSGREVSVNGQQAIDALKSNNAFKNVGVSLREDRPSREMLALAAERLTELSGDMVVPLEDTISKAATKLFPELQQRYASLAGRLQMLGMAGADRLEAMSRDLADIQLTDGSDVPQRLGREESSLFNNLVWAGEVKKALEQGLEATLKELRSLAQMIEGLPSSGVPGELKAELAEVLQDLNVRLATEEAYRSSSDFNTRLTEMRGKVGAAAERMQQAQQQRLRQAEQELKRVPEWPELTNQEQQELLGRLDELLLEVELDIQGLRALVNRDYELQGEVASLKDRIERVGRERQQERILEEQKELEEESEAGCQEKKKVLSRHFKARPRITSLEELDAMIRELQKLRGELEYAHAFELDLALGEAPAHSGKE
ncbi:MAG: BREX system P-loop protein BrxC [Halomonas sp.]|uniref:BREX system P-loop protein BrxC n=1 Tax=Halomonas sp. TaxID=1486246 RepID=UPI002ACE2DAD|nr:BREX system P-loop protein BrxC [Halomonas sp.]MDZ7854171.1 BREX system P-loop protein BrxC [Halomonas sp.]